MIDYAGHGSAAGGGRATSFARRRRFCAMAPSVNSSCAPRGPRNLSRPSRKMRLRWANSISTRLRLRRDCSNAGVPTRARARSRASSWMLRGILRSGVFRTASGLQRARATVRDPCAIKQCRPIVNVARRVQQLALGTDIDIARLVEGEVTPAQRALIFAPRLVDDRNVRRDFSH